MVLFWYPSLEWRVLPLFHGHVLVVLKFNSFAYFKIVVELVGRPSFPSFLIFLKKIKKIIFLINSQILNYFKVEWFSRPLKLVSNHNFYYLWNKAMLLWLGRDHTTAVLVLTKPLGGTLLILITRHAFMLESTLVASMVKLCQDR